MFSRKHHVRARLVRSWPSAQTRAGGGAALVQRSGLTCKWGQQRRVARVLRERRRADPRATNTLAAAPGGGRDGPRAHVMTAARKLFASEQRATRENRTSEQHKRMKTTSPSRERAQTAHTHTRRRTNTERKANLSTHTHAGRHDDDDGESAAATAAALKFARADSLNFSPKRIRHFLSKIARALNPENLL